MQKVVQKFFTTAKNVYLYENTTISGNCKDIFINTSIINNATDFSGNIITTKGNSDIVISGLNHCGKQKFFKTAGTPNQRVYYYGGNITSNCKGAFLVNAIHGPTALDFDNNVVQVNGIKDALVVAGVNNHGDQKFFKTSGSITMHPSITLNNKCERIYITGALGGTTSKDFNGSPLVLQGNGDIIVASLDFHGNQKFFITAGGQNEDSGNDIITNDCGIFVIGNIAGPTSSDFNHNLVTPYSTQDIFVAGLNKCGKQIFFKHAGGQAHIDSVSNFGSSITSNDECSKNIYVTGNITSGTALDFDGNRVVINNPLDVFVAGFNPCGDQIFFVTAGGLDINAGVKITDNKHGVFVTGFISTGTATDFNGDPVKNIYGGYDIFVAGLNKCGKQQFFVTAGNLITADSGSIIPSGISIKVNDDGIFITGVLSGSAGVDFSGSQLPAFADDTVTDIFVAKLDFCGNQKFFVRAGGLFNRTELQAYPQIIVQNNEIYVSALIGADVTAYDFNHTVVDPTITTGILSIFVARLDDICGKQHDLCRQYRSKRTNMTNFPR